MQHGGVSGNCGATTSPRPSPKSLPALRRSGRSATYRRSQGQWGPQCLPIQAVGFPAITGFLDHAAPVHGKTPADMATNRALRSVDRSVAETKERAFALLSIQSTGRTAGWHADDDARGRRSPNARNCRTSMAASVCR